MKKSVLLGLIFVLLLATNVFALRVSYDSIQEEVLPGQSPKYTVHLTNDNPAATTVTIKSIDLVWVMDVDSTSYDLAAGATKDVVVTFTPLTPQILAKPYGINFQAVTSSTRETKLLPVLVVAYKDTVDAEFTSLPTIDPRRSTIVKVLLKNKHNILLEDLDVRLESQFFKESQKVTLQGKEQKELEFPISLDPETVEGQYTLNVLVDLKDKSLVNQEFLYTIGKYSNVHEVVEPQQGFLVSGNTVTQKNEGNAVVSESYKISLGSFDYRFTDFNPEPSKVSKVDGKKVVEWSYNLKPGESMVIKYTTDYREPLVFTILVVGVLVLFYVFGKKFLEVSKRVLVLHTTEGGMAIMKVVVTVRNPGKLPIKNVSVMDVVPHNVKAPTEFGSIKPSNVKASPEGLKIYWELPVLRGGEEKALSYKIESKMQLNAKAVLPSAAAKFMKGSKKIMAHSSAVALKPR
ncbi:MAG: hypothetical protein WC595_03735 [Candidatus Nanoarchaeia archaeon]